MENEGTEKKPIQCFEVDIWLVKVSFPDEIQCALSAISVAGQFSWKEVFVGLIEQAHRHKLLPLIHYSLCIPRHLTHFLCSSDVLYYSKNCYLCFFSTCYPCYFTVHIIRPITFYISNKQIHKLQTQTRRR